MKTTNAFVMLFCFVTFGVSYSWAWGTDFRSKSSPLNSDRQNETLLRRLIEEGFNERNTGVVDEIVDSNYTSHLNGVLMNSSETVKKSINDLMNTFPDFKFSIKDLFSSGDKVALRYILEGTHHKTNKTIQIHAIFIGRFLQDKLVEGWHVYDPAQLSN